MNASELDLDWERRNGAARVIEADGISSDPG